MTDDSTRQLQKLLHLHEVMQQPPVMVTRGPFVLVGESELLAAPSCTRTTGEWLEKHRRLQARLDLERHANEYTRRATSSG